jgi:hypothetical protein
VAGVPGYAHADRQVALAQRAWMAALPRRIVLALPDGRHLAVLHRTAAGLGCY